MTWTVLYEEGDKNLAFVAVTAPHGEREAWDYITEAYSLDIIAIIPGNHNIYSDREYGKIKELTPE